MSRKFLLGWAITATVLMLLAVGFALGKRAGSAGPEGATIPAYGATAASTDPRRHPDEAPPVDPYTIPRKFAGLPAEWRSDHDGKSRDGYAILLDPQRRELIVEKCHHAGYFDFSADRPIEQSQEFCDIVLWSTLTTLGEQEAKAVTRTGEAVDVKLALTTTDDDEPRLELSFGDHGMKLVAGSKNDLLQSMEAMPDIRRQKNVLLKALVAEEDRQRKALAEKPVPRYTLPAGEERDD